METLEASAERVEWSEISAIADDVFGTWVSRTELKWAEFAWAALDAEGLTSYTSEVERITCLIRLLALGAFYRDFCATAFDEGRHGEWPDVLPSLLLDEDVDLFSLGQLTERAGIEADNSSEWDGTIAYALTALIDGQYRTVISALRKQWGETQLFATMWLSPKYDTDYPLSDDVAHDLINYENTSQMLMTYEWLMKFRD